MIKSYFDECPTIKQWSTINCISIAMIKNTDALAIWTLAQSVPGDMLSEDIIKDHFSLSDKRLYDAFNILSDLGLLKIEETFVNRKSKGKTIEVIHSLPYKKIQEWINE